MVTLARERCPANHPCPIVRICPEKAVVQEGYDAPRIDADKCVGCNKCVKYCGYGVFRRD